jgi:hypothetical protein
MDFGQLLFNGVLTGVIAFFFTRWLFRGAVATELDVVNRRRWFVVIWIILLVLSFIPAN